MAFSVRHPVWLPAAPKATAVSFAVLFAIESLARALLATVISVQAFDLLQSSQRVSLLFTLVGMASLTGTLLIPLIIARTARRFIYSFGALCLIFAALALASYTVEGQVTGMLLRVFGAACLNITMSLYILDHIRKSDLVRSEPLRLSASTLSWTLGPALGVWLYTKVGIWVPFAASAAVAVVLLAMFWYLRLTDNTAIQPGRARPLNPIRHIMRFAAQPRLRLAWLIAFGRSCYWVVFFIYGPLLMLTSGLGKQSAGLLVSAGNATLFLAIVFGRISERYSVRRVISFAFFWIGAGCVAAGVAGREHPLIAGAALIGASIAATAVDGIGGIPFMRAVRYHERGAMTGVYRTYLDMSELLPAALFSALLIFLPLETVFFVLGGWVAICGLVAWRYLPKRL